ncbi:MAG: DNA-binding response regulator [Microbacterium sp.]|jgi:DNA-binding NarL/FixJ family response regulator|uniref:response regulator n=1 Tax=Microbacterium sp. TaxID=51671 RepID=UPI00261543DD|nr:response regulator transcription factor [Microbacterium sp.]MDF2558596.1 DNA-binding response regulator [Microbacterium sp.]
MTPPPIRVVVADDQPLVRMGNALVLDSADDIEVIGEVGSGEEAVALASELHPDVVLMDVRMPSIGGIEATRLITTEDPRIKVIVFTTFDIDEYAFGGLNAGASAFLLKSATPESLTAAVRTVAAGDSVVEPRITKQLVDHYVKRDATPVTGNPPSPLDRLTPREYDIFLAIATGLSNPEISARLHLTPATVKTHVNRVFAKLYLRDRVQAVILAYELDVL